VTLKGFAFGELKNTRQKGQLGENLATKYLQFHKFKIIKRNFYYSKHAEVDIIAIKQNILFFIEVKSSFKSDQPGLWVTPLKQRRIFKAAQVWLQRNPKYTSRSMQFDVITLNIVCQNVSLQHYPNAFIPFL
jgi:putative endonuclease